MAACGLRTDGPTARRLYFCAKVAAHANRRAAVTGTGGEHDGRGGRGARPRRPRARPRRPRARPRRPRARPRTAAGTATTAAGTATTTRPVPASSGVAPAYRPARPVPLPCRSPVESRTLLARWPRQPPPQPKCRSSRYRARPEATLGTDVRCTTRPSCACLARGRAAITHRTRISTSP